MFRKWIIGASLVGLVFLTSCAGEIPSVKTLDKLQQSNRSAQAVDDLYVIGPGDILTIDVWKEPELSKTVSVRLDGNISLPLVNDIIVTGLTCAQLRVYLTKKYENYLDVPTVSVALVENRSKRIYLLGKVARPGEYVLQKNMTVLQAISVAGGPIEWAETSDIRLIRKIEGTEKTFSLDYDAIVSSKDLSQNIQLKPDDTIYVP